MLVEFSAAAEQDLLDIALYIAEDSPRRAFTFVDELENACTDLAEGPLRFALLQGFEAKGYRRRVHGRYLIIYSLNNDRIYIVRIVAAAMELTAALLD
jgi:toxin ParE1/3/4